MTGRAVPTTVWSRANRNIARRIAPRISSFARGLKSPIAGACVIRNLDGQGMEERPWAGPSRGIMAQTSRMSAPAELSREQVLRYRARASHLDAKLPAGSFAKAAWGGLQDSVPRGGMISLHARVQATQSDSWEDPSVVQIWF